MTEKNKNLIIRPANGMCVDTCPSWGTPTPGASRGRCAAVDRVRGLFGFGEVDGYLPPGGDCPFAVLREIMGVNDLDFRIRNDGQCHACAKRRTGKCAPPLAGLCSMFEPVVASVPLPADPPYDKEQWERLMKASSEGLASTFHRINDMMPRYPLVAERALKWMEAEAEVMRRRANALAEVRRDLDIILAAHPRLGLEDHRWGEDRFCNCPRCQLVRLLEQADASIKGPA